MTLQQPAGYQNRKEFIRNKMFFLIKAGSLLLSPVPLSFTFILAGMFLLWFTRRQTLGKIIVSLGIFIILPLSFNVVSEELLRPLEYKYSPLMIDSAGNKQDRQGGSLINQNEPAIKWIVVLGGGHVSDPNVPLTSQVSTASLVRLTEGVRLYRKLPGSKIVLMGGAVFDPVPEVEIVAKIAEIMNVNRNDLVLEKISKDTEEQAKFIKNIVGNDRFILVTSASHMPRSVALFKKVGLNPVPAPTNHRVVEGKRMSPGDFFPSTGGLSKAENAIYEYLCMAWSKIRNKL
jgi:uncharacterized SAM-binding protein YcdF (DUF218 family)